VEKILGKRALSLLILYLCIPTGFSGLPSSPPNALLRERRRRDKPSRQALQRPNIIIGRFILVFTPCIHVLFSFVVSEDKLTLWQKVSNGAVTAGSRTQQIESCLQRLASRFTSSGYQRRSLCRRTVMHKRECEKGVDKERRKRGRDRRSRDRYENV